MSFFSLDKLKSAVQDVGDTVSNATKGKQGNTHGHIHPSGECSAQEKHHQHRFSSFGPERVGNEVKHYVDGCGYMYAVSVALERAQHEIWILDWWLSPELYLRRPPAANEQYAKSMGKRVLVDLESVLGLSRLSGTLGPDPACPRLC